MFGRKHLDRHRLRPHIREAVAHQRYCAQLRADGVGDIDVDNERPNGPVVSRQLAVELVARRVDIVEKHLLELIAARNRVRR